MYPLIKGLVTLLPSTSTVVEVLESVPADPDVVAACRSLKKPDTHLALDDDVANDREPLADIADIIKVEMQLTEQNFCGHAISDSSISRDISSAVQK